MLESELVRRKSRAGAASFVLFFLSFREELCADPEMFELQCVPSELASSHAAHSFRRMNRRAFPCARLRVLSLRPRTLLLPVQ